MTTNTLITIIDDVSKYYIQVRAAVSSVCRATGLWSEWSQPIYVGEYLVYFKASGLTRGRNRSSWKVDMFTSESWNAFFVSAMPYPVSWLAAFLTRGGFTIRMVKCKHSSFSRAQALPKSGAYLCFSDYLISLLSNFSKICFFNFDINSYAAAKKHAERTHVDFIWFLSGGTS